MSNTNNIVDHYDISLLLVGVVETPSTFEIEAPPANTCLVAGNPLEPSLPTQVWKHAWLRCNVLASGDNVSGLGNQQAYVLRFLRNYGRVSTTERVWVPQLCGA